LGDKYDLVNSDQLRGVGIFTLDYGGGAPELWAALAAKFKEPSSFQPLGGTITSAPAAASWASGRLDAFAQGTDGALWHRWWAGGAWRGWEALGGLLTADAGAVSWGPDRVDVFVRGTDGQLWHRWWDGAGWRGWEPGGGVLASGPAAA